MATAKREKPAFVPPPDVIVLELSVEEAEVLSSLLASVSGPCSGPRQHTDAISAALDRASVSWGKYSLDSQSRVQFQD